MAVKGRLRARAIFCHFLGLKDCDQNRKYCLILGEHIYFDLTCNSAGNKEISKTGHHHVSMADVWLSRMLVEGECIF
jgi:hypothetical protein